MKLRSSLRFCIVFVTLLLFGTYTALTHSAFAVTNKYGIHLAVPSDEDIAKAAELVNGSDGAYGFVTVVIQENNRNRTYWQEVFNKFREKKLIPIVRLATEPQGQNWKAPHVSDATSWAQFLGSLNWVTKKRHVILFNEPNHATEWGGGVNAVEYGRVAAAFAEKLSESSPDYVVMLAGLDLAAPHTPPQYADAYAYLSESVEEMCKVLLEQKRNCASALQAISSHSYPNPGFVASPYDTGRRSIRGYETEIEWYRALLGQSLPVFITETGWDAEALSQETVATYFTTAFRDVWIPDDRVMAITPFILNYQGEPFLKFSFLTQGEAKPYEKYVAIQRMPKLFGTPDTIDTAKVQSDIPDKVVEDSQYEVLVTVENTGQAIWDKGEYALTLVTDSGNTGAITAKRSPLPALKPFEKISHVMHVSTLTQDIHESERVVIQVQKGDTTVSSTQPKTIIIERRPNITVQTQLFIRGLDTASDYELQIFNEDEHLVYKQKTVHVVRGNALIEKIANVVPDRQYRLVLLKPYYLPRQVVKTLTVGDNSVVFDPLLPFDFDRDGTLTTRDFGSFFVRKDATDLSLGQKVKLLLPIPIR